MYPISAIILTKNEAKTIGACLIPLMQLCDEVIVVDTGNTDATNEIAKTHGATILSLPWDGYAATKNNAATFAKNNWILSIDADEVIQTSLQKSIAAAFAISPNTETVFQLQRKMVIGHTTLHFGSVYKEFRARIYHREFAHWNNLIVHEALVYRTKPKLISLTGILLHYSYQNQHEHQQRLQHYATLSARQMYENGKKSNLFTPYWSAGFYFIKNFIAKGGFLDGIAGFQFVCHETFYVYNKYKRLNKLSSEEML